MNTLQQARDAAERWETIENAERAREQRVTAQMYATIALAEAVTRIADMLERAMPSVRRPKSPTCTCGADDCGSDHSDDCPCYVPE